MFAFLDTLRSIQLTQNHGIHMGILTLLLLVLVNGSGNKLFINGEINYHQYHTVHTHPFTRERAPNENYIKQYKYNTSSYKKHNKMQQQQPPRAHENFGDRETVRPLYHRLQALRAALREREKCTPCPRATQLQGGRK